MDTREAIRKAAASQTPAPKVSAPANDAKPAKAEAAPKAPKAPKEPVDCNCQVPGDNGCNGGKTRKQFAPGHDAKLVGYLTREVVAGNMTEQDAKDTLSARSNGSAHLLSKLAVAIPREVGKVQRREASAKAREDAKAEKEAKMAEARKQAELAKADLKAKRDAE